MTTPAPNPPAYQWHLGSKENRPITAIILGMAGSGKTTLTQRLNAYVHEKQIPSYLVNLDPAVAAIPFEANIDIRDSLNYREVMEQYSLGPNGAILTSLNLFSTKFNQVMEFVEKRAPELKHIFVDTPGQIEVFNWSASGTIITEAFASLYPTVYIYVVDTPRSTNPTTFMSNMLYACSLFYKSRIPIILVFTKTDVVKHEFAIKWMTDFDVFDEACKKSDRYMSNFTQSMGLMLGEFYENFPVVGVSSVTGEGMDDLFKALERAAFEYEEGYKVEFEEAKKQRAQHEETRQESQFKQFSADAKLDLSTRSPMNVVKQSLETIIVPDEPTSSSSKAEKKEKENEGESETSKGEKEIFEAFMKKMKEEKKEKEEEKKEGEDVKE